MFNIEIIYPRLEKIKYYLNLGEYFWCQTKRAWNFCSILHEATCGNYFIVKCLLESKVKSNWNFEDLLKIYWKIEELLTFLLRRWGYHYLSTRNYWCYNVIPPSTGKTPTNPYIRQQNWPASSRKHDQSAWYIIHIIGLFWRWFQEEYLTELRESGKSINSSTNRNIQIGECVLVSDASVKYTMSSMKNSNCRASHRQ